MNKLKKIGKEFNSGQKEFGEDIARIINSMLLTVVYFLGVGLAWIMVKFNKTHVLDKETDPKAKTYWKDLNLTVKSIKEYYRQF